MSLADDCRTAAVAAHDMSTVTGGRTAEAFLHCRRMFAAAADELERLEAALAALRPKPEPPLIVECLRCFPRCFQPLGHARAGSVSAATVLGHPI